MKILAALVIFGIVAILAWPILRPVKKSPDTTPGADSNPKPDINPEK